MNTTKKCRANRVTHRSSLRKSLRSLRKYVLIVGIAVWGTLIFARAVNESDVNERQRAVEVDNVLADALGYEKEIPVAEVVDADAVAMAKVIYGSCRYNSVDAQRSVCWLILNRVDSSAFPGSIKAVCEQPNQFMGYSEENPVIQETYDLCLSVIQAWRNGQIRPFSDDYCFFVWNGSDSVTLRNTYEKTANTRYMVVG